MRFLWPVSVLATLVSMGLLVMIIGQKSVITMLNGAIEKQEVKLDGLNAQYINQEFVKVTVEKLVAQVIKMVEELQATVAKLSPELEKKKAQTDSCKAEKKTVDDELVRVEEEHTKTAATLKAESDTRNQKVNSLKAQLTAFRPVCDHVKPNPFTVKLCGTKPDEPVTPAEGNKSET